MHDGLNINNTSFEQFDLENISDIGNNINWG